MTKTLRSKEKVSRSCFMRVIRLIGGAKEAGIEKAERINGIITLTIKDNSKITRNFPHIIKQAIKEEEEKAVKEKRKWVLEEE